MAPKSFTVQLRPGITQATLPDHRKMVPGVQYIVDYITFSKFSLGVLQNVIQIVDVNGSSTNNIWMTDNSNTNVNPGTILSTVSSTPPTYQTGGAAFQGTDGYLFSPQLGNTIVGPQDERYMFVQNGESAHDISVGDVLVWKNEANRTVTNQRPSYSPNYWDVFTFPVDNFAGVAISAITSSEYGYIQIAGEVGAVSVSAQVNAGDPIQVDESNAGDAKTAGAIISVGAASNVYTLDVNHATGGDIKLTLNGTQTANLAYNATPATFASTIQTALQAIVASTTCTGAGTSAAEVFTITIPGTVTGFTVSANTLTGPVVTPTGATTTWTLTETGAPAGGTFTVTGAVGKLTPTGTGTSSLSLTAGNGATAGTFTLTDTAGTTAAIAYNASGTTIAAAINAIGGQTVTWTATNGAVLLNSGTTLTFTTSGNDAFSVGTYSGYTFTTAGIAYNAAGSAIETALNTAGGTGTCTGTSGGPLNTTPVVLTVNSQATLTVSSTGLTPAAGTTLPGPAVTQVISESATVEGGTFGLVWNGTYVTDDIQWDTDSILLLTALKQVPGFPTDATASGGPLPGSSITVAIPSAGEAGVPEYITAAVDENLVYDASGQVFGTAFTSSSSSVSAHIRVNRYKTPYMREYSRFSR